jgi:hypothetical protein
MAYTAGDTILDDEYNTFVTGNAAGTGDNGVNNVNTLWGTGVTDKGYGETGSTLASVSAGSTITATQWDNFLSRIETIAAHQGSTVTAYSTLSAGDTITALSTVATDLATITTNRLNATASGSTVTTGGTSSRTASWTTTVNTTQRIAFASADALRYFFNAGGLVQMTYSRSGGTSSNKNTEWTDLCTKMGTITLSGSSSHTVNGTAYTGTTQTGGGAGGAGSSKSTIDAHALTGSLQQLIVKFADTAPYTANFIKIEALVSGANIDIKTTFTDDAADTGNPAFPAPGTNPASLDIVDGTLSSNIQYVLPSATQLTTAAWGTPTLSTTEAL